MGKDLIQRGAKVLDTELAGLHTEVADLTLRLSEQETEARRGRGRLTTPVGKGRQVAGWLSGRRRRG